MRQCDFRCPMQGFREASPSRSTCRRIPWFNVKWENGNDSVNGLLVRFLHENGLEYLRTFNGDIWFLYHDVWECCTYEVKDGWVCRGKPEGYE